MVAERWMTGSTAQDLTDLTWDGCARTGNYFRRAETATGHSSQTTRYGMHQMDDGMSGCVSRASRQLPCGRVQCAARARSRVDEPALGSLGSLGTLPGSPGDGDGSWASGAGTDHGRPDQDQPGPGTFPHSSNLQLPGRLNHHPPHTGHAPVRVRPVSGARQCCAARCKLKRRATPPPCRNPPSCVGGQSQAALDPPGRPRPEEPAQPTWEEPEPGQQKKGAAATLARDAMAPETCTLPRFHPICGSFIRARLALASGSALGVDCDFSSSSRQQTRCSRKRDAAGNILTNTRFGS